MDRTAQASINPLARLVLAAFVITFAICRLMVFLIMSHRAPNLYLHVGQTHIHHMSYGIFIVCGTGAYLLFYRPTGNPQSMAAVLYGIGLGLIFDEYGMWFNMSGSYWQQASCCSVMLIAAMLGLIVAAPKLGRFTPRQWIGTVVTILLLTSVGRLLARPVQRVERKCMARLTRIEQTSPR